MTFITPETPAARAAREHHEALDHAHALDTLARLLVTQANLDPRDADNTVRALDKVLNIRLDTTHGVLTDDGMVVPTYAYRNPWGHDTQAPGWAEHQAAQDAAYAQATTYTAVRATTGWHPDTRTPGEDDPHATP